MTRAAGSATPASTNAANSSEAMRPVMRPVAERFRWTLSGVTGVLRLDRSTVDSESRLRPSPLPPGKVPKSIFGPSGGRGNVKTMFDSDGHVVLDILLIRPNYTDRQAVSIAHLRVIAEAAARGLLEKIATTPPVEDRY